MAFQATAQRAALAVAARIGIDLGVSALPCCGALDRHLGFDGPRHSRSMRLVALDSGCIDSLRDNGHHVDEWCAFLLDHASLWQSRCREKHERVALWVPCTHRRLGAGAVKALLARLGVTVVELDGVCCGAAGPNVLSHTSMADALAEPLLAQLPSLNVSALITTNVGCAMHLSERLRASGSRLPVRHPAELLLERLS
jgi:glycolate oxidase iron-sulfur subunit